MLPAEGRRRVVVFSFLALVLVVGASAVAVRSQRGRPALQARDSTGPVIIASDVSLLATTGQPQLVEFFHPS